MSDLKEIRKVFTKEELKEMPLEELLKLAGKPKMAPFGGTISGTGVVRRADGTIKYDDPSMEGKYNERD